MPTTRRPRARTAAVVPLAGPLSIQSVIGVARDGRRVRVDAGALRGVARTRAIVDRLATSGAAMYGINTGFGSLARQRIAPDDLRSLQRNLVRSHAAGAGEPLRGELVRAMMLCLAASLSRGLSGVRPEVVTLLVGMLNAGVTPVVPSIGSVGASGDLAPLAHLTLVLIGEGHATLPDSPAPLPGAQALKRARLTPLTLEAKEGLALINGTHLMAGEAALLAGDARRLLEAAITALAMSIDACRATDRFLDDRLYAARVHSGPREVAGQLRALLEGSRIVTSHVENDPRVQDPYSLRAAPTILGAVADALGRFEESVAQELAAVTDNPLVFPKGSVSVGYDEVVSAVPAVLSGANFHGMPIALPLDQLAIALAHVAGVSERRAYLITGAFEPESHLKPFLAPRPGLQSGLMIAQYTAAACVNEIIGLCTPASVANIPTCAGMEDYNSFGPRAAAKARRILELARTVVAVEFLCAAAGLEHHRPLRSGTGVERACRVVRSRVEPPGQDRPLDGDIRAVTELIESGAFDLPNR